jgi:hypothetical protein
MVKKGSVFEALPFTLAATLTMALAVRSGPGVVTCVVAAVTVCCLLNVGTTERGGRRRFIGNCCMAWLGYLGSTSIIEALRLKPHHAALIVADRWLFGETPSISWSSFTAPWIGEMLSGGYLSYQLYLHWVFIEACFKSDEWRERCGRLLFTAFAAGFTGYFAFPASPPSVAFPGLYAAPLAGAGLMKLNDTLNAAAAARYDAFPSLHVLITLTLLRHDWARARWRFWLMLAPSMIMMVSTLALRLHYAVDLMASVLLFALLFPAVGASRHEFATQKS